MTPARFDIRANRKVPFVEEWFFTDDANAALDFTGASGLLHVRLEPGTAGSALIALATVTSDVPGIRFLAGGGIRVRFSAAQLDACPASGIETDVIALAFDLIVTMPGDDPALFVEGTMNLYDGVTVP